METIGTSIERQNNMLITAPTREMKVDEWTH